MEGVVMSEIPNLAGIVTEDLVESIGSGSYSARYINWAKTLNLLHEHAPGWLPHCVHKEEGDVVFRVANSGYVQIYFVNGDTSLPPVVQAIMDNRHKAVPFDQITAVDVSNAVVRGYCKAAAVCFGLAFELWSGDSMESGYSERDSHQVLKDAEDFIGVKLNAQGEESIGTESVEDWKTVAIHFGKNKGKKLDELSEKQLSWYQGSWDPTKDRDGNTHSHRISDDDKRLRAALDASLNEDHVAAQSMSDEVPF
jgi:hypothetical protein